MTRCQSRWVNLVIIALVVILRAPTLLPSLYTTDEAYYGTIANDILDGGAVYRTAVDTKPPGMYYIYAAFSEWLEGTTSLRSTSSPYLSSWPPPWCCGESVREWRTTGQEHGVALAMSCSSMLTGQVTRWARTARFSPLFRSR